jgi:hypothetical protein
MPDMPEMPDMIHRSASRVLIQRPRSFHMFFSRVRLKIMSGMSGNSS